MAVKAEIAGQKAKSGTYNATDDESITALKTIVATDLVSTGSGFEVADPEDGTTTGTKLIKIRYSNTALKAGGIDDGNPLVPAQNGHVNYVITVTAGDAELTENITDENFGTFTAGTGNSGGGNTPVADPTDPFGAAHPTLKADFGKKVSGYNAKKGSNWRLFYADTNFAYLICDRIDNAGYALNNSTLFSDFSTATMSDLGKNLNPKCSTAFWTNNAEHDNVRGISGLLNTAKWTDYSKDGSGNDIANWAIGAPTVEMFIASYNETHTTQLSCTVDDASWTGYKVRKGTEAYNTYEDGLGNSLSVDTAIYCNGSYHWWLASPSADNAYGVVYVNYNGTLNYRDDYDGTFGVRPLVSIPISKIDPESATKTITILESSDNRTELTETSLQADYKTKKSAQ